MNLLLTVEQSDALLNLASALVAASNGRLMSLEHAGAIWKNYIRLIPGLDVSPTKKDEGKVVNTNAVA